jgi:uncharacterized protein YecE (DUF72 family)
VHNLSLFDEPSNFDRVKLATKLRVLAEKGIYVGGSSWKYEGWLGQIYTPERYSTRGRFSKQRFEETCLAEYAETFPIVCGDFSFYQFPTDTFWRKLFATAPPSLKFGLKVPEEITVRVFPTHPRYGARAGLDNPSFLNADLFEVAFLELLRPHRERVAVLIFEFGTFSRESYREPQAFVADLDRFLTRLPRDFQFSVEVRNADFLVPEYFAVLKKHGVAHVFNAWTRMPVLPAQLQIPDAFTTNFVVSRAQLRRGRPYEEAVKILAPYSEVKDENPEAREGLRTLIDRANQNHERAYLFVNNRLEGNSPITIQEVVSQ